MKFNHYLVEYLAGGRIFTEVIKAVSRIDSMKEIVKRVPHCVIFGATLCY